MAPGAARIPALMCAPSKAGPDGDEHERSRSPRARLISVLVPMSSASAVRRDSPIPVDSSAATWSAPT